MMLKWLFTNNWFSRATSVNSWSISSIHKVFAGSGMPECRFFFSSSFFSVMSWLGISMTWLNRITSKSGTLNKNDKKSTGKPRSVSFSLSSMWVPTCCGKSILSMLTKLMERTARFPTLIPVSSGAILFSEIGPPEKFMDSTCMTSKLMAFSCKTTGSVFPAFKISSTLPTAWRKSFNAFGS